MGAEHKMIDVSAKPLTEVPLTSMVEGTVFSGLNKIEELDSFLVQLGLMSVPDQYAEGSSIHTFWMNQAQVPMSTQFKEQARKLRFNGLIREPNLVLLSSDHAWRDNRFNININNESHNSTITAVVSAEMLSLKGVIGSLSRIATVDVFGIQTTTQARGAKQEVKVYINSTPVADKEEVLSELISSNNEQSRMSAYHALLQALRNEIQVGLPGQGKRA